MIMTDTAQAVGQTATIIRTMPIDIELGQHRLKASSYALLGRCCFFRDAEGNVILEHKLHEVARKCFPYSKHRAYEKPLTITFLTEQDLIVRYAGSTITRGSPVYQFRQEQDYRSFQGDLRAKQLLHEFHVDSIFTVKTRSGRDAVNECIKLWQTQSGSRDTTISFPALRHGAMKDFELPLKWFNSPRPVKDSNIAHMELARDQVAVAKQSSSGGSSIFSKSKSKHSSRTAQNSASAATPVSVNTVSAQSVFAPQQFIDEVGFLDIKFASGDEFQTFMKAFEHAAAESGGRRDSISANRPSLGAGDQAGEVGSSSMSINTSSTACTGVTSWTGSSISSAQLPHRSREPSMTEEIEEGHFTSPPCGGRQDNVERLEQNQIPPRQQEAKRIPPALNLPPTTATGLVPRDAVIRDDEYSCSPILDGNMTRAIAPIAGAPRSGRGSPKGVTPSGLLG
ncbi:hypothetical protein Tdes44962_MAKER02746 [Teratosphaeria destructans]|uniref:Uncharacterized protein n=1 Tax=Teratosphaeria destructans TaxID=418781 RepID=A0A9W7W2F9_9PEZI|nr:hypothetical protein Tdes44962_MAKER02746 [Teratosphaeria destructans]